MSGMLDKLHQKHLIELEVTRNVTGRRWWILRR